VGLTDLIVHATHLTGLDIDATLTAAVALDATAGRK